MDRSARTSVMVQRICFEQELKDWAQIDLGKIYQNLSVRAQLGMGSRNVADLSLVSYVAESVALLCVL